MSNGKNFEQLLAELKAMDEPKQVLLVKSSVARKMRASVKKTPQVSGPGLGLLIKAAVGDAVAAGRLSGTSAVAGLKALGLDDDGKAPATDELSDAHLSTLASMSPDQQRAAIDHLVHLGKISGSEALACLRKLGLES